MRPGKRTYRNDHSSPGTLKTPGEMDMALSWKRALYSTFAGDKDLARAAIGFGMRPQATRCK